MINNKIRIVAVHFSIIYCMFPWHLISSQTLSTRVWWNWSTRRTGRNSRDS